MDIREKSNSINFSQMYYENLKKKKLNAPKIPKIKPKESSRMPSPMRLVEEDTKLSWNPVNKRKLNLSDDSLASCPERIDLDREKDQYIDNNDSEETFSDSYEEAFIKSRRKSQSNLKLYFNKKNTSNNSSNIKPNIHDLQCAQSFKKDTNLNKVRFHMTKIKKKSSYMNPNNNMFLLEQKLESSNLIKQFNKKFLDEDSISHFSETSENLLKAENKCEPFNLLSEKEEDCKHSVSIKEKLNFQAHYQAFSSFKIKRTQSSLLHSANSPNNEYKLLDHNHDDKLDCELLRINSIQNKQSFLTKELVGRARTTSIFSVLELSINKKKSLINMDEKRKNSCLDSN